MRFTINVATRTHIDRKLVNRYGYAVLVLLLLLLVWNISRASWSLGELRRLQTDNAAYEKRLNDRPSGVSEKDFASLLADIRFYNDIIERKSYNWLVLLDQLEMVTPEGIALSVVSPDRKTGDLKIEGHARNFALIRSYHGKLEDSKLFTFNRLLSHANVVVGEKGKGVKFAISSKAAFQ
jgi:type IV pilus assembly protein PilN